MTDSIQYGRLMHKAMRGLLAEVLRGVAETGLPGQHHFYITFETAAPGVDVPDWLRDRYPDEMTIVMQEWFDDLDVTDDGFSVTLNFGNDRVTMTIPFEAIHTFVDPSVEFGLRFEPTEGDDGASEPAESPMAHVEDEDDDEPRDAEVVSLDSFRKH
jgi:hypothetical protein